MCMMKRITKATILKSFRRAVLRILMTSFGLVLLLVSGCKELEQAVDRHGDYFYLTKNYGSVSFALWGKELLNQDNGKFVLLPSPSAIFPGIPLFLVENFVICPVIDICLLPTDFWRNVGAGDENGCYVQVMDVFGRPVPGVEVRMSASNMNKMPVVYKGRRQKTFAARGITDENGELFVPVDMTTVESNVAVSTAGACEKGRFEMTHYRSGEYRRWTLNGRENPDQLFPKRDKDHIIRVVLEPELVWPDGRNARWSFTPEKSDKILWANNRDWSFQDATRYDNLTDLPSANSK